LISSLAEKHLKFKSIHENPLYHPGIEEALKELEEKDREQQNILYDIIHAQAHCIEEELGKKEEVGRVLGKDLERDLERVLGGDLERRYKSSRP